LERAALEQLANAEDALVHEANEADEVLAPDVVQPLEAGTKRVPLHRQRHDRIIEVVRDMAPKSVVDLGCGDGKLIRELMKVKGIEQIVGMDVAFYEIEKAFRKLNLDDAAPRLRERVKLLHGSLMYRDERLHGFDLCTIVEVVEHLDPPRLAAFERVVFLHAAPKTILLTTPNREYNELYGALELRHGDHRFEWTRSEFETWATRVAGSFGYHVRFEGIGELHESLGAPSQMAVFTK
jgi:3' terminal RNA ribose 2'-O-methyltransferase Hen1